MISFKKGIKRTELTLKIDGETEIHACKYVNTSPEDKEELFCDLLNGLIQFFTGNDSTEETCFKMWLEEKLHKENWDFE